jgi:hypothetical protein
VTAAECCLAPGSHARWNGRSWTWRSPPRFPTVDELMVTSQIFDHEARLRSFGIVAAARDALIVEAAEGEAQAATPSVGPEFTLAEWREPLLQEL